MKMTRALARRRLAAGRIQTFTGLRVMFRESKRESEREWKEIREQHDKELKESKQEWKEIREQHDKEFQESKREWEEIREQHDKELKESERKSELAWEESRRKSEQEWKEIREQMKETDKKFGELGIRFGEVVEHLVAPGIEEKFKELGYNFIEVAPEGHKIFDENGQKKAQIDILLENGKTVMAVEVKSKPNNKDIKEHVDRLKILRESRNKINDKRKIEGAIAGAIFPDNVKTAAQGAGLFVIVQSGDTMRIEVPKGWVPKAW
jgi:hypothetical protein